MDLQEKAFYGLPEKVIFCKKCTISNQRPSSVIEFQSKVGAAKPTIQFDAEGVCSACRYAEVKANIDWSLREKALMELCDRHRSKDGSYDCLVPGSGGKDSAYTAHILKFKYKMNPLTVTWAPHMYTDIGWKNFQSWIHSGFDNYLYTPNGDVHRFLTQLAFKNLVHPFQPFIIGQRLIAPRFSAMLGIPLIFYGENQAEYGNAIHENERPTMAPTFYESDKSLEKLFLGGVSAKELVEEKKVSLGDLNPYLPVDGEKLRKLKTEVHYLGYYLKWDPQELYYYAAEHGGFQANTERTDGSYSKYSSIDDKLDTLHFYTTFIKFGIGRATYDSSQEIRNGKITREEGVALIRRYDHEPPKKYMNDILEYLNVSAKEFEEIIDKARSPHLWECIDGAWRLKWQVN